MPNHKKSKKELSFLQKTWIAGLVFALIIILILFFSNSINVFILILVGALIACYFRGLGTFIHRKTKWSSRLSLSISVIGTILVMAGTLYLMGATIASQTAELEQNFPKLIDKAKDFFENTDVGKEIMKREDSIKSSTQLESFFAGFFKTTFGGIGDIYVILLIGIYFTVAPEVYKKGVLQLIPPKSRDKANAVVERVASDLTKWLFGKFVAMFIIFVSTAIALAIVGLPAWLVLAFIAGLLVFIPNFGPIISAIPALLVALAESGTTAIIVGILYIIIQVTEGSFITPKLQNRLVQIPPALIILAQVFAGILIGVWGIIFATPIALIIKIIVEELYIKPMDKKAEIEA